MRGIQHIGIAVDRDVSLLQSGKMPVKGGVVILPIALAQRHSHAEAENSPDSRVRAGIQNAKKVLLRVVEKGKDRTEPDHRRNAFVPHGFQHLDPFRRCGDMRLDDFAERFVERGQRHLHHAFCLLVNALQQRKVAEDTRRFGENRQSEAVALDDGQTATGETELLLDVQVGVAHRPGADHAAAFLFAKRLLQQLRRVDFDLDVLKFVRHAVAFASGVAVNAAVRAAAVEVHPVFGRENALCVNLMQIDQASVSDVT